MGRYASRAATVARRLERSWPRPGLRPL